MLIIGHQSWPTSLIAYSYTNSFLLQRNFLRLNCNICSDFHFSFSFQLFCYFVFPSSLYIQSCTGGEVFWFQTKHVTVKDNQLCVHLFFDRPDMIICLFNTVFDHSNMICQWSSADVAGHQYTGSAQKLGVKLDLNQLSSPPCSWLGGWGTTSSVCSEAVTTTSCPVASQQLSLV